MVEITDNLKLFKWNTEDETDLDSEFDIDRAMNENWDKLDENDKTVKETIETIQSSVSKLNEDIENIQAKDEAQDTVIEQNTKTNTKQDKLIQTLIDSTIRETMEEATSLHVENASTVPAKLEVRGNCKQETRSEKNLYNVNDCSDKSSFASVDDDDWITLQLKSAQSVQLYLNYLMNYSEKIKTSSTYYLVIEIKEFSGTGSLVVSQYLDSSKSQISTPISLDFSSLTTGKRKYTVSTINDFTDVKWMIRTFASFPTGSFGKIVFRLSLLEEEPDLDTFVYQKYGASPSLDYPSPVRALGDNVNTFKDIIYNNFVVNNSAKKEATGKEIKVTTIAISNCRNIFR